MDNATRRQILERAKQIGYPGDILSVFQNPQLLDEYEQQLQTQLQQQPVQQQLQPEQPQQQFQPITFPTPPVTTPNYKVPQPRQSEAKPLVMSFNETSPQLMRSGGLTDPPTKSTTQTNTSTVMPLTPAVSTAVNPTGEIIFNQNNNLQLANKLNNLPEVAPAIPPPPPYYPSDRYISGLKIQENGIKSGFNNKENKWYSHESVEGGTNTIAYGHKLTQAEAAKNVYSKGLSEEQATELLKKDLNYHINNTKRVFNDKYGKDTFDAIPNDLKDILVDYSYNGVLEKFPTFTKGVYNYSIATTPEEKEAAHKIMMKEYQRKTGNELLTSRNAWTKEMLQSIPVKKYGGKKCYTCNSSKLKVLYNKANYKK